VRILRLLALTFLKYPTRARKYSRRGVANPQRARRDARHLCEAARRAAYLQSNSGHLPRLRTMIALRVVRTD